MVVEVAWSGPIGAKEEEERGSVRDNEEGKCEGVAMTTSRAGEESVNPDGVVCTVAAAG